MNLNKPTDDSGCCKDDDTSATRPEENCCDDGDNSSVNNNSNSSNNHNNNCSSRSDAEDFVTASDCTGTPPSRSSSSYHTPSDGEAASNSPWWELDTTVDPDSTADSSKCLQLTDESQQVCAMYIDVYVTPHRVVVFIMTIFLLCRSVVLNLFKVTSYLRSI